MYPAPQLNELLKKFVPACSRSITNQQKLAKALVAPYLTYYAPPDEAGFSEDDSKAIGLIGDNGLLRTPFPMFRFCVQSSNGSQMIGFVESTATALAFVAFFREKQKGLGSTFYAATFNQADPFKGEMSYNGRIWDTETLKDISEEMKYCEEDSYTGESSDERFEKAKGKIVDVIGKVDEDRRAAVIAKLRSELNLKQKRVNQMNGMLSEAENVLVPIADNRKDMAIGPHKNDLFMAYYRTISIICYEYLAPQNFVAAVRSNKPGKSVEWQKAREHMTIIHRYHPANSNKVSSGATVDCNQHEAMRRCAHSRRAHTRLLRSPKFKYKMGQRVAVRSSWCGPKEWQDSAGQTYQILVPAVDTTNAIWNL